MKTECCVCMYRDVCKWKDAIEGVVREVKDDFAIKAKDRPGFFEDLLLKVSQLESFPILTA